MPYLVPPDKAPNPPEPAQAEQPPNSAADTPTGSSTGVIVSDKAVESITKMVVTIGVTALIVGGLITLIALGYNPAELLGLFGKLIPR
ncbi:hypothetical protein ACFOY2_46065 [Nonomuraea purpurea]|uniref:Uncharacterized protein n=1 Tax=Nonomuraea purpurea TaxID=1849276 RepID=A0ABV8GNX9_9ACTN